MRCSDIIERFFFSSFSRKETRTNRRRVVFKREIRCLYGAIQVGQRRWISRGIPLKFFCARTPRHPRHHRTERKVEGEREKAPLSSQLSRVALSEGRRFSPLSISKISFPRQIAACLEGAARTSIMSLSRYRNPLIFLPRHGNDWSCRWLIYT